jgi:hypothetical protein
MYADHRGDHLVDEVLLKLGLAVQRGEPSASAATTSAATATAATAAAAPTSPSLRNRLLASRAAKRAYRYVATRLPHKIREALLPFHRAMVGAPPPWDWTKTRVFRLPSVGNSYLRVNLAGREPAGVVTPGEQYDTLLSQIDMQLRALVDPATGDRVVEDVYFPATRFQGPRSSELPDVAIVWSSRRPITAIMSNAVGVITGHQPADRSGNHRPEGFALFRGPSFAAAAGTRQGDARQIAPVVLEVFGIQAPAHYEMQAPEMTATCRSPASDTNRSPVLPAPNREWSITA